MTTQDDLAVKTAVLRLCRKWFERDVEAYVRAPDVIRAAIQHRLDIVCSALKNEPELTTKPKEAEREQRNTNPRPERGIAEAGPG